MTENTETMHYKVQKAVVRKMQVNKQVCIIQLFHNHGVKY